MPLPVIAAAAILALGKAAGTLALKAKLLGGLAPLQSYLAAQIGASAASIGTGALAAAAAAAWWAKLTGADEDEMAEAAGKAGAGKAAREIARWVMRHS
ncbi:hypothetical protein [Neomegalonema sp.]|uniref:hypothetical protein n=1 Tax=Neomegalonema sp. TaxID=2039713 RepID=UPI0026263D54|nr:hypothetical protein [Neomegalonema sp.]MDD2870014.1 hypothetical protein [Neomegalonema sp.]